MTAPTIGVTSNYSPADDGTFGTIQVGESYIQAVIRAGGLPLIIPVGLSGERLQSLIDRLDGILFTGGSDVNPLRFQGQDHPRIYGIDDRRDELEISLVNHAVDTGKPFLGICRGVQVINVALGGSLYTHIADQMTGALRHDYFPNIPRNHLAHGVWIAKDSLLAHILGSRSIEVNSLHHQGINRIAPGLRSVAHAPDQMIEGVELPGHPFGLGVQWHPEWLQEHAQQRELFKAFVEAADKSK